MYQYFSIGCMAKYFFVCVQKLITLTFKYIQTSWLFTFHTTLRHHLNSSSIVSNIKVLYFDKISSVCCFWLVSVSVKRCMTETKNLVLVVHQEGKCEMSELSTYPQSTLETQIWPNYYTTIQLSDFGIMRIERCLHATRQSLSFNKQLQVCE